MTNRVLSMALLGLLATGCDDAGDDDGSSADAAGSATLDADTTAAPDADTTGTPDAAGTATIDAGSAAQGFVRHTVDGAASGPAYVAVDDLDGDGSLDVVVSAFGKMNGFTVPAGTVKIYTRGGDLDTWTAETVVAEADGVKFPGQPTIDDLDGDGDKDILLPSGFLVCNITFIPGNTPCGALAWYEQTPAGWVKHALLTGQVLFYHHAVLTDLSGDGVRDLVTVGEEASVAGMGQNRAEAIWLRGKPSGDRFETGKQVIGAGLGSFPRVRDLDGDGDQDVASAEFFIAGSSFAWYENAGNALQWTRHVINADSGPSIQLSLVDDLTGDGKLRAIGANHTNTAKSPPDPQASAVFMFDIPADPEQPWTKHTISEGIVSLPGSQMSPQGAPGVFGVGDVDGDDDLDVLLSGDGDPNVYWLEQTAPGVFATRVLEMGLEQAGGMAVVDLDDDGQHELVVTGYLDDKVYVYERDE